MGNQSEINSVMRAILVDWIVEVHLKFRLTPETLYLAINIIDRYLEREQVERKRLQLVGVTALLVACKFEVSRPSREVHMSEVRRPIPPLTKGPHSNVRKSILPRLGTASTSPTRRTFDRKCWIWRQTL